MHPHYCCSSSELKKLIPCLAANMPRSSCWVQGRLLTEQGKIFWSLSTAPHHTQFQEVPSFSARSWPNHKFPTMKAAGGVWQAWGKWTCKLLPKNYTNNPASLSLKSEQLQAKGLDWLCRKQRSVSLHQPHHKTSFYQSSLKNVIMCFFSLRNFCSHELCSLS